MEKKTVDQLKRAEEITLRQLSQAEQILSSSKFETGADRTRAEIALAHVLAQNFATIFDES